MIQAGVEAWCDWDSRVEGRDAAVERIYRAMAAARDQRDPRPVRPAPKRYPSMADYRALMDSLAIPDDVLNAISPRYSQESGS